MSRYSKFPQGLDEKLPMPPSMKNDIVLTPNREALHANSSKQPFALTIDSRDRNMELYPNPNNYVIQIPRYKDVLSVELTSADVPHSGYNIDSTCNIFYMIFTKEMFIQYYNGVRINGVSYIEAVIPQGNYEASDLLSIRNGTTMTSVDPLMAYQCYYDISGTQSYTCDTGILATALKIAVNKYADTLPDSDPNKLLYRQIYFTCVYDFKTTRFVIVCNAKFAVVTRDKDNNFSNQPFSSFFMNQTPAQADDSYLGANNDHFQPLPNSSYNVLGFEMKNYFPVSSNIYNYQFSPSIPYKHNGFMTTGLIDYLFDPSNPNYVRVAQGQNYYWPPPYPVSGVGQYNNTYNPANPCDASLTGLDDGVTILSTWVYDPATQTSTFSGSFCIYSLPNRPNFNGDKYIILDIPELNYRDITNINTKQFYCKVLFDTAINVTPLQLYYNSSVYPAVTNLATVNTVKYVKAADIGNNRCTKFFTPTLGVLGKLTIRWLKYDGTPYNFQGQDHALNFEILTLNQSATYFN